MGRWLLEGQRSGWLGCQPTVPSGNPLERGADPQAGQLAWPYLPGGLLPLCQCLCQVVAAGSGLTFSFFLSEDGGFPGQEGECPTGTEPQLHRAAPTPHFHRSLPPDQSPPGT